MPPGVWVVAVLFGLGLASSARADMGPPSVAIDPNRVPQGQQTGAGVCLALAVAALGFVAAHNWRTGLAFGLLIVVGLALTLAVLYLPTLFFMAVFCIGLVFELPALYALGMAVYQAVRLLRRSQPGAVEWWTFGSAVALLTVAGWLMADSVYSPPKYRPEFRPFRPVPTTANQNPSQP
jgi:hypothetical protein